MQTPSRVATLLLLCLLVGCVPASQGPKGDPGLPGPPGPGGDAGSPGGGFYTSRGNVYCRDQVGPLDAGIFTGTVTASCDSVADLPLTGTCDGQVLASATTQPLPASFNLPVYWDVPDGTARVPPAAWECLWLGSPPPNQSNGHSRICCIKHP
jgi:hypothetical protein